MAKISINQNCIGCGSCAAICPDLFELENGKARPKKPSVTDVKCAKEAAESCPVKAISVK